MQPTFYSGDALAHVIWLAGFLFACFATAATFIVWRESTRRELAEATVDGMRMEWRPLDYKNVRTFRPIKFKPRFTAKKTAPEPRARLLAADIKRAAYLMPEQFTVSWESYYDITTHGTGGARAVSQWEHPTFGAIDATEFMAAANTAGITKAVAITVLRSIFTAHRFHSGFMPLYVSLPAALANGSATPTLLRKLCASCGIAPDMITFCVAEAGDYDIALALRAQGFGLALDDCRAITHAALQRLPLTCIIAGADLTHNLHTSPAAHAMLGTIAQLGQQLGLSLIAAGVDNASDAAALNAAGFEYASGTFFATAAPRFKAA